MSVFKKQLMDMVLSDHIKLFNCLNGSVFSAKGLIAGLKDGEVVFINLETLQTVIYSIGEFEDLFKDMVDNESDIMLKKACKVLFY